MYLNPPVHEVSTVISDWICVSNVTTLVVTTPNNLDVVTSFEYWKRACVVTDLTPLQITCQICLGPVSQSMSKPSPGLRASSMVNLQQQQPSVSSSHH